MIETQKTPRAFDAFDAFDAFVNAYGAYRAADCAWRIADKNFVNAANAESLAKALVSADSIVGVHHSIVLRELSVAQDAVTRTLNVFKAAHNALLKARNDCYDTRRNIEGVNLP